MKQSGHLNHSEETRTGCPALQSMEGHLQASMEVWVDNNNKRVVGGEGCVDKRMDLGFTNPVRTGGVLDMCLGCGGVGCCCCCLS